MLPNRTASRPVGRIETGRPTGRAQATAVGKLTATGVSAHGSARDTLFGHTAREIIDDAEANDIDVIVMGSRGRGDLAGLLPGSTAHKAIHLTHKPVLVAR